jgi:integrase
MPPKKGKITFTVKWLNAQKPADKEVTWTEGHGFTLRVLPSGVKTWWYLYTINNKRRKMNLGHYPHVSLEEARRKHREALRLVVDGVDPQNIPEPTTQPENLTVRDLADKWVKESTLSKKWLNTLNLALKKDVLPQYGNMRASDLRRRDAIELLKVKALTAPGQARNIHKALRSMWELAKDEEYVEFNPFAEIKISRTIPSMKQKSRARFLSEDEIKFLWTAIDIGGGSDSTKRALKLMLITGQRNGEVCGMRRKEISLGIGRPQCWQCKRCGWWTIPAERREGNKGGEHRVYLSPLAIKIVGGGEDFIFPGDSGEKALSANSVNYHVRRLVEGTGKLPFYGLPRWTPHDLRRTASTHLRRLGCGRDNMNIILGHSAGGITGVYDRYEGDPEKMRWLAIWSEYIHQLVGIEHGVVND